MDQTVLKLFALLFMTLDHIGTFIPNTPYIFNYIGRLAGSIFFFCTVEGYTHTRSKGKYLFRIYIMAQVMSAMDILLPMLMRCFYPEMQSEIIRNNVFIEIFGMLFLIYLCEKASKLQPKAKRNIVIAAIVIVFCVYQCIVTDLINTKHCFGINEISGVVETIFDSLLGLFWNRGGLCVDFTILLFYVFRGQKKKQVVAYALWCCLYLFYFVFCIPGYLNRFVGSFYGLHFWDFGTLYSRAFNLNYQWMMIFSLPFYMLYNGKRGKGLKSLFYLYYPAHIAVLYCISTMMTMAEQ